MIAIKVCYYFQLVFEQATYRPDSGPSHKQCSAHLVFMHQVESNTILAIQVIELLDFVQKSIFKKIVMNSTI